MAATAMRNCVFQGRALPASAKMPAIGGTTTTMSTVMTPVPTTAIRMG